MSRPLQRPRDGCRLSGPWWPSVHGQVPAARSLSPSRSMDVALGGGKAGNWLTIRGAKTSSGNRTIPCILPSCPCSSGWLGSGPPASCSLTLRRPAWTQRRPHREEVHGHEAAAWLRSKRFHSLRHMFVQQVRAQVVPEDLVATWSTQLASITGARYGTAEARRKLLPEAVAKLTYPGALKGPK